jgi:transcriptional regulator with XRE-family HTH domain
MPESLGARLRRRREEQQIALSTIAERTKIKTSLLEALERDDVSHWPAGIYRRAFIRSYATAVGLDPDPIVREFLERYPDPEEAVVETPPPPAGIRGVFGLALGSLARLGRAPAAEPPPAPPGPLHHRPETPAASRVVVDRDLGHDDGSADPVTLDDVASPLPSFEQDPAEGDEAPPHREDGDHPVANIAVASVALPPAFAADLASVAQVCTGFARVQTVDELPALLEQMAHVLGARGLIAWVWDPLLDALRPALAYGYSGALLEQLPTVRPDDDNATAAAFRSSEPCAISGTDDASGALVVPLVSADGAGGVLAIELPHGWEQDSAVRALATICAAMLAPLIGVTRAVQAPSGEEPDAPPASFAPAARSNGRR